MDWIAAFLGLLGCFLVGEHKRYGWLFYVAASSINMYLGYKADLLGLTAGSLIYLIFEFRGWLKHDKRKK